MILIALAAVFAFEVALLVAEPSPIKVGATVFAGLVFLAVLLTSMRRREA